MPRKVYIKPPAPIKTMFVVLIVVASLFIVFGIRFFIAVMDESGKLLRKIAFRERTFEQIGGVFMKRLLTVLPLAAVLMFSSPLWAQQGKVTRVSKPSTDIEGSILEPEPVILPSQDRQGMALGPMSSIEIGPDKMEEALSQRRPQRDPVREERAKRKRWFFRSLKSAFEIVLGRIDPFIEFFQTFFRGLKK